MPFDPRIEMLSTYDPCEFQVECLRCKRSAAVDRYEMRRRFGDMTLHDCALKIAAAKGCNIAGTYGVAQCSVRVRETPVAGLPSGKGFMTRFLEAGPVGNEAFDLVGYPVDSVLVAGDLEDPAMSSSRATAAPIARIGNGRLPRGREVEPLATATRSR